MYELNGKILELFNKTNRSYTFQELRKYLNIKGEESLKTLKASLFSLSAEGKLMLNDKNRYIIFPKDSNYVQGQIYVSKLGSGRIYDFNKNKIVIPKEYTNGAITGDIVLVLKGIIDKKGIQLGSIERIIKRENDIATYEVKITNRGGSNEVLYKPIKGNLEIELPKKIEKNLVDGEIISVRITPSNDDKKVEVEFIETLGHKDDPDIDMKMIANNHNVKIDFNEDSLEQLKTIPSEVNEEDIADRKDLRNLNVFTIDGAHTKDIDDALSINVLDNGNYLLGVHIAHVSHYIKENTPLFKEAITRGTSYYLGDTVIPMLPHQISNGICSLNPNVDRLAKSYLFEIDKEGNLVDFQKVNSVINSRKKMTYSDVNKILEDNEIPEDYEPFEEDLKILQELSNKMTIKFERNGKADFGDNEIEYEVVEGKLSANKYTRRKAERMIENFMILAGNKNAEFAQIYELPFVNRIHEEPNDEKLEETIDYINSLGYNVKINGNASDPKTIKNILGQLKNYGEFEILARYFLCAMARARFSVDQVSHYGLGLNIYAQVTSPIRRAGDLINQALSDKYEKGDFENLEQILQDLISVCSHISKKEREADEAENESDLLLMAKFMEQHIGEEFEGYISFLKSYALTVRTVEGIIGKVNFEDLNDDYYLFNSRENALVGKKSKNKYRVGNKVTLKVLSASKMDRTVNFEIVPSQKVLKRTN